MAAGATAITTVSATPSQPAIDQLVTLNATIAVTGLTTARLQAARVAAAVAVDLPVTHMPHSRAMSFGPLL